MTDKREKALVKNTLILGLATFFPKFVSLVTLPILTTFLSKSEYGQYDLFVTLSTLIFPMATLQISSAAFRFLIQKRNEEEEKKIVVSNILFFTTVVSVITTVILIVIMSILYGYLIGILVAIYMLFENYYLCLQQIARGLGENLKYSLSALLVSIFNMIFIILLVYKFKLGIYGVLISLVLTYLVVSIVLFFSLNLISKFSIGLISKSYIREMINYSWPFIPNNLSSWVMWLSDRMILTIFCGSAVNAVYAVANKIPNLISSVSSTFGMAWQENASIAVTDGDVLEYYKKMFDTILSIVIGAAACIIGMSPYIFSVLINKSYAEAYPQMSILFIALIFNCLSGFLAGIYVALKKTMNIGITTTLAAILNLFIDIIFVREIGIWAASISTLVGYAFLFFYRICNVRKFADINFDFKTLFVYLLIVCVMCYVNLLNNKGLNLINLLFGLIFAFCLNKSYIRKIIKSFIIKLRK